MNVGLGKTFSRVVAAVLLMVVFNWGFAIPTIAFNDADECPDGWQKFSPGGKGVCCASGSTEARNPAFANLFRPSWCYDANNYPKESADNKKKSYCASDQFLLAKKCYDKYDNVELNTGGKIFLGCKTHNATIPVVWKKKSGACNWVSGSCMADGYPKKNVPLDFCIGADSAYWGEENSCVCADNKDVPIENPDGLDCEDESLCGPDNVFYDDGKERGEMLRNPEVACTTRFGDGVLTALGCIPVERTGLANWAILFGTIIGGIIAVFKIIQGSFMVMTATGNPDKLQEGKSVITSALIGLVVIVSAVVLLQFMGTDLLGLDQFGFNLGD